MSYAPESLKILLVADDDDQTAAIRSVLATSTIPRLQTQYVSNGWDAQCQARIDCYEALVIDDRLSDSETLLGQLRALGVSAPALLLTSTNWDEVVRGCDDHLARADALIGSSLVRTIVATVRCHTLTIELTTARDEAARATTLLAELVHDLATPLGVVMGMTQALLSEDNGLSADDHLCLEDVSREALRACEILKRVSDSESYSSAPAATSTRVPDLRRTTASGPGSRMVLIADDDAATRRMVAATLSSDQYSVLQAADGKEAWRLIRDHHPAVAILDWQMPVYTGLELTDVIKGDPQVRSMTVIMLTGRSTKADREAGARARADLYLTKPFSPQELLAAVEQALGVN